MKPRLAGTCGGVRGAAAAVDGGGCCFWFAIAHHMVASIASTGARSIVPVIAVAVCTRR